MNTFLKGLLGAAALAGVSFSTASAQDYTWTLDLQWDASRTFTNPNYTTDGNEPFDANATGTFTLTRTGANSWSVSSWNIVTTSGTESFGTNPTMFAVTYDMLPNEDDAVGSMTTTVVNPWQSIINFTNANDDYRLTLVMPISDFINKMNDETEGAVVELVTGASTESQIPSTTGTRRRSAGTCELSSLLAEECGETERSSGTLTLSSITPIEQPPPTATPEPASMALFGAGLLGLFATRRRRAA